MKKKNYLYIFSGILFLTLITSSTISLAWKNGKNPVPWGFDPVWNDPVDLYKNDYTKSIPSNTLREYYGTHNWIAESALELLYTLCGDDPFLYKLWDKYNDDKLRYFLLYGTELPDVKHLSPLFKTRCGYTFSVEDFSHAYHYQILFSGGMIESDIAAQTANKYYQKIKQSLQEKDCQKAAAFIGAMMHVIADVTLYYHLIKGTVKKFHFEDHVFYVTYKTWINGDRKLETGSIEFFDISEARTKLQTKLIDYYDPYMATVLAAVDTYYGSTGFKNAKWLLKYEPTATDHKFWMEVEGTWGDIIHKSLFGPIVCALI